MDYKEKYLKYKSKYLQLYKQIGGVVPSLQSMAGKLTFEILHTVPDESIGYYIFEEMLQQYTLKYDELKTQYIINNDNITNNKRIFVYLFPSPDRIKKLSVEESINILKRISKTLTLDYKQLFTDVVINIRYNVIQQDINNYIETYTRIKQKLGGNFYNNRIDFINLTLKQLIIFEKYLNANTGIEIKKLLLLSKKDIHIENITTDIIDLILPLSAVVINQIMVLKEEFKNLSLIFIINNINKGINFENINNFIIKHKVSEYKALQLLKYLPSNVSDDGQINEIVKNINTYPQFSIKLIIKLTINDTTNLNESIDINDLVKLINSQMFTNLELNTILTNFNYYQIRTLLLLFNNKYITIKNKYNVLEKIKIINESKYKTNQELLLHLTEIKQGYIDPIELLKKYN